MRRLSARTVLVVPWLLLAVSFFSVSIIGWIPAAAFALLALVLVIAGASEITKSLRSVRNDLRAGTADFENKFLIKELHDIAAAAATVNRELSGRASLATNTEQQLNAVLDSITEGILQVTAATRFVRANQAARAMLNLPRGIEGQTAKALIRHPDLRLCIERAATGASFEPIEITLDDRHLLVSPRPFRSSSLSNQTSGAVIAIVDFTEYRRLESVRRDFVANVSHELKTPLTSIRGYAETLISDDLRREVQLQFLEVVRKNADRIQRIVDDLLDLSRLQSGGWQPELQEVDPVALAEEVWTTCEDAQRKNITFSVETRCDRDVLADPGGLRQILSNLFDNAIRYTPAGGHVTVVITPHRENGNSADPEFLDMEVIDNGTGIPRESLPRIFERFYRVDPARSRADGGTGLGLSIVKHLAESMSGDVAAESELGKGTTIRVTLPAAPAN
jgi:two-component system, OmpR family, phosphate regulon sensor histidine kinase PhoR